MRQERVRPTANRPQRHGGTDDVVWFTKRGASSGLVAPVQRQTLRCLLPLRSAFRNNLLSVRAEIEQGALIA